jgi:hypothetical protein
MADRLGITQEELFKMLLKRLGGLKEYNSYDDEPYYSDVPKSTPNKDWDTDDDVEDRYSDYEEDDSEDLEENKGSINYNNLSKHSIKDLESLIDIKKKEREKLRSNTNIPPAVLNTVKELGAQISKIERELNSKKAQSLDENEKSFDDVLKNFLDTDDSTEIRAFIKAKGRDAIAKIKAKLPALKDQARQKLAKLMKIELDESRLNKEAQTQTPADATSVTALLGRVPMIDQKLQLINNAAELQPIFDYILDRVNPSLETSVTQLRTALNQAIQVNLDTKKSEKSGNNNIKERLKPAITKLVQEVLDEMGQ